MTNEQWIIVYVICLVLFPFIVQLMTIPLLFLADLLETDDFDRMRRILTRAKYKGSYGWLKKQEGKNDVE